MSALTRREFTRGIIALGAASAGGRATGESGHDAIARESVTSADGTNISYAVTGDGPAIVFSHESLESGQEWMAVAAALSDRFRCFVVDRRGRGHSGPAGQHSITRECEDLEAVLRGAGARVTLLGASYGAVVALETALRAPPERLIIYEPPLILGADSPIQRALQESFDAYERLTKEGRLDEALALGLEKLAGVPAPVVGDLRTSAPEAWRTMRDLTPTWVPEIRALRALPFGVDRYQRLQMPALLVSGSESAGFLREVVAALDEAMPDASRLELAGQGHEAHITAPALLAAGIAGFLGAPVAGAQPRIASRR